MPLSTGQILNNRYRIVKLLGQGGFGAVYRAWDTNLNGPCAVKESTETSAAAQSQFAREASLLFNLKHANLPKVFDSFSVPGQGQYLVMEYVEGEDLSQMLGRIGGALPEAQALGWIGPVCDALTYLHSQSPPVIHRDIKPANIRIAPIRKGGSGLPQDVQQLPVEETCPYLVDFGIAKVYDPRMKTMTGARAVTPGYSPHEQYGQGSTDARTDVYALGATLYALLTGVQPVESVQRMIEDPLPPPERLNPRLSKTTAAAIWRAMQMDPKKRFQSVEELKAALAPLPSPAQPGRGAEVRVVPPTAPAPQPWQPHPTTAMRALPWGWLGTIGVLGLIVVVLVAVVVIGFILRGGKETPTALPTTAVAVLLPSDTTAPLRTNPPVTRAAASEEPLAPTTKAPPTPTALAADFTDQHGVKMKLIPAGEFEMGSESGDSDEGPVHTVYLEAFYMDVYEVTNQLFAKFLSERGNQSEGGSPWLDAEDEDARVHQTGGIWGADSGYEDHPVVEVTWYGARAFCEWRGARLPSEAEWEKAARGGLEGMLYPWGNEEPDCSMANYWGEDGDCVGGTTPVGSYPPNGYGLFDMAGNVWEWVMDWYSESYYAGSPSRNPTGPSSGGSRVLRGGWWGNDSHDLRVDSRTRSVPTGSDFDIGFRCSRSP